MDDSWGIKPEPSERSMHSIFFWFLENSPWKWLWNESIGKKESLDFWKTLPWFSTVKKTKSGRKISVFCWKKSKGDGMCGTSRNFREKFARFFVGICKLGIFVCCLKECQGQLSSIPFAIGQFVQKRLEQNNGQNTGKIRKVWNCVI